MEDHSPPAAVSMHCSGAATDRIQTPSSSSLSDSLYSACIIPHHVCMSPGADCAPDEHCRAARRVQRFGSRAGVQLPRWGSAPAWGFDSSAGVQLLRVCSAPAHGFSSSTGVRLQRRASHSRAAHPVLTPGRCLFISRQPGNCIHILPPPTPPPLPTPLRPRSSRASTPRVGAPPVSRLSMLGRRILVVLPHSLRPPRTVRQPSSRR